MNPILLPLASFLAGRVAFFELFRTPDDECVYARDLAEA